MWEKCGGGSLGRVSGEFGRILRGVWEEFGTSLGGFWEECERSLGGVRE